MVLIRAEEDREMLKHFTPEQHKIRNEWRRNHTLAANMTEEEKEKATQEVQKIFAQMFG